jgi:glutamyl-tRNA synthetase
MGWDHLNSTANNPTTIPFFPLETLTDPSAFATEAGSSTELFTLEGLVEAFDLKYITRRRAIVSFDKLDWVNKMHLRREALLPEGSEGPKPSLVDRFMALLREQKVLEANPLISDPVYVKKVLDAELVSHLLPVNMRIVLKYATHLLPAASGENTQ